MNPFDLLISLRTKKLNLLAEISFLKECQNSHVFPKFISKQTPNLKGQHVQKCLKRNQSALLRAAIQDSRAKLSSIELQLYNHHMELAKNCHPAIWNNLDTKSFACAHSASISKRTTLFKKLQKLKEKDCLLTNRFNSNNSASLPPLNNIVNKSSYNLSNSEQKCLQLGLNHALPPPKNSSLENLIADLDFGLNKTSPKDSILDHKHAVKTFIAEHINSPNPPHFNNPFKTINDLSKKDIYVVKSDKGNQVVILDKVTYEKGISNILSDSNTYKPIKQGPTTKLISSLKSNVNQCTSFTPKEKSLLIPSIHNLPRIYALPKIHKINMPFRPIVSNSGSITHPTARFIASKIKFLGKTNLHTVNNSANFIKRLTPIKLCKEDILVSFDVTSLFTNIPTSEALDSLSHKLRTHYHGSPLEIEEITKLADVCINNTFFKHGEKVFQQISGLAMGSPLSPILADCVMDKLENHILNNDNLLKPKFWIRYVDDIFCIWPHGRETLSKFLDQINSFHPTIKFTIEIENNRQLPFLDVLVRRTEDNNFETSVYRKPNTINTPPHFSSAHPWSQKMSTFNSFIHRAINLSSNPVNLSNEIILIKNIAINCGYDPDIIDHMFRKISNKSNLSNITTLASQKIPIDKFISLPFIPGLSNKIGTFLKKENIRPIYKPVIKTCQILSKHKTKIPKHKCSGIYSIPCSDCDSIYIGQTKRAFQFRLKEHQAASAYNPDGKFNRTLQPEKSAVAHHIKNTKHQINWEGSKIIKNCKNHVLNIHEQMEIFKNQSKIMNKQEDNFFPGVWRPLLKPV